jgi:hypothetical protein
MIPIWRHKYKARMEGRAIRVTLHGEPVDVTFGATMDHRTVTARVPGVGFIGGWTYPHRAMPWEALAESISAGILYEHMSDLPNGRRRRYKMMGPAPTTPAPSYWTITPAEFVAGKAGSRR